jgi:hypothetical protein
MSSASKWFGQAVAVVLVTASIPQCQGSSVGDDENQCIPGELDCVCNEGQCLEGLACIDSTCVVTGETETDTDVGSDSSTSEEDTSTETEAQTESETESDPCVGSETLCDGECVDLSSDDNNCGECGKTCKTGLESGGCVEGACAPVWSDCVDASNLIPCSEVCEAEGLSGCATAACHSEELSIIWYGLSTNCASGEIPTDGQALACETQPLIDIDPWYRCCCAQQ